MLRRLYFLFPDEEHAQLAVNQLYARNVSQQHMHAISRGVELKNLPEATERQKNDTAFHVEQFLWKVNLIIFAAALIVFVASVIASEWLWSGLSMVTMLTTFFGGKLFIERVPHDHLTEFTSALAHGEILLMVDVPLYRVTDTVDYVEHLHPEARLDGASWMVDAFGI
ncbi:MAG: hypothetical protein KAJ92_05525 [Gammaproteobacteria bacterium]|nr:hypothetical protein [Gammaproteobacteria bacterium]